MKSITSFIILLFCLNTLAATDHVGVFHRMDKVIILINEPTGGPLDHIISKLGLLGENKWLSEDGSFKMSCGKDPGRIGCTIRLLPSDDISIGERDAVMQISLNQIGVSYSESFEIAFESSRKDKFIFSLSNGILRIYATKRDGYSSLNKPVAYKSNMECSTYL